MSVAGKASGYTLALHARCGAGNGRSVSFGRVNPSLEAATRVAATVLVCATGGVPMYLTGSIIRRMGISVGNAADSVQRDWRQFLSCDASR